MRSSTMRCAMLAWALAAPGPGCKTPPSERTRAPAPPVEEARDASRVRHAGLREIEVALQSTLNAIGKDPDLTLVYSGAGALHAGADRILLDRPQSVRRSERIQYEGLVLKLKRKAQALREAATRRSPLRCRRSFQQVLASCVRCHTLFREHQAD
ncbi:hypothetical protein ACFL59_00490 [Planctomycetota bacterium]